MLVENVSFLQNILAIANELYINETGLMKTHDGQYKCVFLQSLF